MGRQKINNAQEQESELSDSRPKRKATNAHIFRYLQTRNPGKLEENDLKRALEASLEECPDFWPEDTASCSSSDQSNGTSASSIGSTGVGGGHRGRKGHCCNMNSCCGRKYRNKMGSTKRKSKLSSTMQLNHLCNSNYHSQHQNCQNHHHHCSTHANSSHCTANHSNQCCPMSSVHNRYKPVAKKNIYNEADFFHDGIMEYIEFELMQKGHIVDKKRDEQCRNQQHELSPNR